MLKAVDMMMLFRCAAVLLATCSLVAPCEAQLKGGLPSEAQLNRFGLTLNWWGRAIVDPKSDKVLFVTNDEQNVYTQTASGIVTTLNGESGRKLWANLVGPPDQTGYPVSSNDDHIFLSVGLNIYAMDKQTGELVWQLGVPHHPSASPEVDDDHIYVGMVDGSVYTYDIHKVRQLHEERLLPQWTIRAQMWNFKAPLEIVSQPVAYGSTVSFAGQNGKVYGLSAVNKKLRFQFESQGKIFTPVGRSIRSIFIADDRSRMYCIDQLNGRVRWAYSSGAPIRQQPYSVGQHVYAIPTREGLVALSTVSGRVYWEQPRVTQFLAASETRVYGTDVSGNLLVIDRSNGELIGAIPLGHFDLKVSNERTDRIYLASSQGLVVSLREISAEFPAFHLHPERQPILPYFAEEEPMETTEPPPEN